MMFEVNFPFRTIASSRAIYEKIRRICSIV
jgi:hypothetical protein